MTTEKKSKKSTTAKPRGNAEPLTREQVLDRYAETGYALDLHPAHIIRKAHQRATLRFQQVMAGEDLSPTQFAALATILKHGEVSQNHLGRLTAMDPSTISIVMRKLLKHGLITRSASDTDQRLSMIALTEKGTEYTLERLARSVEVGRRFLSPLSPAEQTTLLRLLKRINDDDPSNGDGSK
ncbi:MarR family transcriptional regulator [Mesorhizobium huakuii]|uniref:MarR family winged helix-turn-helix transcriptional regulator n=1 Tax=Mesorhizobium huakuii TaxID=28104 RepID=A0ABZ0VL41_9HYPH|nr:MarR family winged helix-turn-helix transcriptional regulator [Mesorhizobium huakuii]WQB97633.1 MarR family winged helix-turn-helix transcriptional regulator [Mesorhizobium huakuii]GLQ77630.1 MarR family transcriptional regulator [Mesorhizobium huakuii]